MMECDNRFQKNIQGVPVLQPRSSLTTKTRISPREILQALQVDNILAMNLSHREILEKFPNASFTGVVRFE